MEQVNPAVWKWLKVMANNMNLQAIIYGVVDKLQGPSKEGSLKE